MSTAVTKDIIRIILFVLTWLNSFLAEHGYKPLPVIDETQVSWAITFIISVWVMIKDNPFRSMKKTSEAQPVEAPSAPAVTEAVTVPAPVAPKADAPAPEVEAKTEEAPVADAPKTN
jgi:SPP1 family holin